MKNFYKIGIERDIFATNGRSGNPSENFHWNYTEISLEFQWNNTREFQ